MKKRKRLNNKGFTLIELLAVIVILAIVMGISASSILSSINNSRKSSLYSAAQTAANQLNQWVTEDAIVSSEGQKMLGDKFVIATQQTSKDTWICLNTGNIQNIRNRDGNTTNPTVSLLKALGINTNDIVLSNGTNNKAQPNDTAAPVESTADAATNTCSALKYNTQTGGYEVLLIAKNGGKYYVTTDTNHYAFSRATDVNKTITD